MAACAGMGFFLSAFLAVGIEFGAALTFPADEAAVYSLLDSGGELFSVLLISLGGAMSDIGAQASYCALLSILLGVTLFVLRRMEAVIMRPSSIL